MQARKSFRVAGAAAAFAVAAATLEIVQGALRNLAIGKPNDFPMAMADSFGSWAAIVALAPAVFAVARRWRIDREPRRAIPIHIAAAILFGLAASLLVTLVITSRRPDVSPMFMAVKIGTLYTVYYFAVYWAITAAAHALALFREAQARELALTRARLDVLRTKLNPHFLFNTLNAISTMSLQRANESVTESLALLADLLRVALDDDLPQEIPLARELELNDKYLAVQQLRFGDRMRVERDVDPAALSALVPSMLLQPLVENAIVYGVAAVPGEGSVGIRATADKDNVRIEITDSGPGFPVTPRNGTGLAITRERLATLYGGAASLDITRGENGGARVTVTIPRSAA